MLDCSSVREKTSTGDEGPGRRLRGTRRHSATPGPPPRARPLRARPPRSRPREAAAVVTADIVSCLVAEMELVCKPPRPGAAIKRRQRNAWEAEGQPEPTTPHPVGSACSYRIHHSLPLVVRQLSGRAWTIPPAPAAHACMLEACNMQAVIPDACVDQHDTRGAVK